MQCVQALEVNVGAVHDVGGTCFRDQQVEHVDVVELALRDVNEARDGAT